MRRVILIIAVAFFVAFGQQIAAAQPASGSWSLVMMGYTALGGSNITSMNTVALMKLRSYSSQGACEKDIPTIKPPALAGNPSSGGPVGAAFMCVPDSR